VGDDDQGIYSWRGADINNIMSFQVHFPKTTTVVLDINYRSTKPILEAALAVVARNRKRTFKQITAAAGDGEPITVYKADDEIEEAEWICAAIIDHAKTSRFSFKDHALLMRTNAMMRRFEEEMRRKKIPYRVYGAMSFFDRKEIKDVLAYLRFFANTGDETSLARMLKVPDRGIASSTMEKLEELAGKSRMGLWDAMLRHNDADLQPLQHAKCSEVIAFYHVHAPQFAKGELSATMRTILRDCNYMHLLERSSKDNVAADMRGENVEEILRGLEMYEHKMGSRTPTLAGYLQDLSLLKSDESDDEQETHAGVSLMTLHKSKGLEFPVVFLCNLDDTLMPSPRTVDEGNIEEERRLFYVGMTRARKLLFLTYPARKIFRKKDLTVTPCRFIREIPEQYLNTDLMVEHEEKKQEYVTNFFEEMRRKFAEKTPPSAH
jgi:superfamily I DNA/RNA helicase